MSKTKILSFSHYGALYGANRSLLTLLKATRQELDWQVICRQKGDFTDELIKLNIPFSIVPFKMDVHEETRKTEFFYSTAKFIYNIFIAIYLAAKVVKSGTNLIHSNASVMFIGQLVAFFSGRKHIWHIREFVYEDYNLSYNFGRKSFRFFAQYASRLVCISKSILQKRVVDAGITADYTVVYNGLIADQVRIVAREKISEFPVVGILGVINPAKNQLAALKAINILLKKGRIVHLHIVGDINNKKYYEVLQDYISKESISEYIHFTGFVKNISEAFHKLDVMLMCSHYEALGRVTIESMLHGVPVIGYAAEGSTEIIEDEKTGLLYLGDEHDLSNKLEKLLTDDILYQQLSRNGLSFVSNHFTINNYRDHFLAVVNSLA